MAANQPEFVHLLDQLTAMWRDFAANSVPSYFKSLVLNGFTREEALTLTLGWQNEIVRSTMQKRKES